MATSASRSFSWEETFQSWGKPPGTTEQEKCDNAVRAVRKAIDASTALTGRTISVSPQGSYHNRTNVRADSDVDVRVVCDESIFFDLPEGSLYPALYRLEQAGFLDSESRIVSGRTRRIYAITPSGRAALRARHAAWRKLVRSIAAVMGEGPVPEHG